MRHILLLLSCLFVKTALGQNIEFVENKGQWDSRVKFMGDFGVSAFFIHPNGYTVLQNHPEDWQQASAKPGHGHDHGNKKGHEKKMLRSHAYKVDFLGGNPNPQIIPDKPILTYNNYFIGNDPSKWAANCKIYQAVTIKDVYPNIDVRYYSGGGQLKYDLIVRPGGNPSRIMLKFDGADKLEVKNKQLIIKTSVGDLKELEPYSYQAKDKGRQEVQVKYVVKNKIVQFDVKDYDPNSTLVIDPTLTFCSFSGSTTDNWGYTATYGPDGTMFGGGTVKGNGFPVSPGAFQTSFAGGCETYNDDIGIIKLTPDGSNRVYATYIGGNCEEQPHSLVVDGDGNLVIAGRSNSSNYPVTGGALGNGGGYDIIITKLNASGTALIGSKKIGGVSDDGANISANRNPGSLQQNYGDDGRSEVILDNSGNIYVASCTKSVDFPVQNGFQMNFGGQQDGVLIKMNSTVSTLLFASYLGGSQNDAAYVLSLHPFNGNIYVAGGTESGTNNTGMLPGPTAGTVGPSYHGGIDGFVSIVSNDGSSILRTAYIGTSSIDQVYGVQFDRLGFPYIMGQTRGNMPMINAAWGQPNTKQFVGKLQPDLSEWIYRTTFGAGTSIPNISPVAFLVDRCENVYVSGWGGKLSGTSFSSAGTFGLPITSDAIKTTTDVVNGVGQDLYFIVIKKDAAALLYGSFFGQDGGSGDHVDGGTSRFDANGVIYQAVCGNCKYMGPGSNIPTTPGAWYTTNPATSGGQCNLMMIKVEFEFAGVGSGVQSAIGGVPRDTAGCLPLTVQFRDTIANAVRYYWTFGDGSPQVTTVRPEASHTYTQVGTYRVMLIAEDSTTCNIRDTSYINIRVGDLIAQLNFNPVKLNPCDSFLYRFDNLSVAPPARPFTNTSFVWDFGDGSPRVTAGMTSVTHRYRTPGTYNVKLFMVDTAYCNYPDSLVVTLRVAALVDAEFTTPARGCVPYQAVFTNTSQGGQQFFWDFGDGTTSTAANPTHLYTVPGTYVVRLTAIDSATCNIIDSTRFTITVYPLPVADFSAAPQPPVVNTPITFTNLSSPDAVRFKWVFGDGDSLVTTSRAPVQHEYNATRTYRACLTAYNANNCASTVCRDVSTLIEPALDVPNAFTPLSRDANSKIFVRGFGIAKMKFIIWSRWGEKVFETNDKRIGWDGTFKGKMMPMDVYAYTLEVEFSDGTKATKKGDITLIR